MRKCAVGSELDRRLGCGCGVADAVCIEENERPIAENIALIARMILRQTRRLLERSQRFADPPELSHSIAEVIPCAVMSWLKPQHFMQDGDSLLGVSSF